MLILIGRKEDKGRHGGGTEKGRKEGDTAAWCSIMTLFAPCMPPTHSVAAYTMQGNTKEVCEIALKKSLAEVVEMAYSARRLSWRENAIFYFEIQHA